ncbi:unnamed protein product [Zymoseptoria tritici ST99CH_1A5]|uniref:DUF7580 domain-containing protein n=2 Tax=Zymoseptoria tritici TaxID=1047171 RepID=A0A1X7RSF9_ZYMT9|nr:unnamed protein product [Zymoseptoria tritici ST99CH_3D7]SMY24006.1 unnamed protein product [Zymoseptoria tritici ST99CH_1A5]
MSGVEVIGLVLGAIPLIISGLEHYKTCVKTIKSIKHTAVELGTVARNLRTEGLMFRNTLQILLSQCLDHETQKQLLDASADGWDQGNVRDALQQRLQTSYELYMEHVHRVRSTLSEFMERLHLGPDGKPPCDTTAASFRSAYKRLGFAIKKSGYLDLIQEIHDVNVMLERLTGQTRELEAGRKLRAVPDFETVRLESLSIFSCLAKTLHVSCSMPHQVSILLSSTAGVLDGPRNKAGGPGAHTYRIVVEHNISTSKAKAPRWNIAETDIKHIEAPKPVLSVSSSTAAFDATISHATGSSKITVRSHSVRFQSPSRIHIAPTLPPILPPENVVEIRDLCEIMDNLSTAPCGGCVGYMTDDQSRHGLYTPETRLIDQKLFSVGRLSDCLGQQRKQNLTGADARRLALSLATGMLQLHSTPWLQSSWGKSDIMLISKQDKILSQHAFISQDSSSARKTLPASPATGALAMIIKNRTLFSLGLMLIELCMGKSMEDLHRADERNPDGTISEFSDLLTAERLLNKQTISESFGKRWSDVVRRCIRCEVDETESSLEDAGFRKAVYNKILMELEEEHRQFFRL